MTLIVYSSGCGYIVSKGPPENHAQLNQFSCTESSVGSFVDIAGIAIVGGTVATGILSHHNPVPVLLATGAAAGLFGSSAVVGFSKAKRCRDAQRQLRRRHTESPIPPEAVAARDVHTLVPGNVVQISDAMHGADSHAVGSVFARWYLPTGVVTASGASLMSVHMINLGPMATQLVPGTAMVPDSMIEQE